MIRDRILDSITADHLKRGLDAAALRHRILADNIANAGVAGHERKQVEFESLFDSALRSASSSSSKKPVLPEPRVVEAEPGIEGEALVEREMTELVENSIKQRLLAKLLSGRYDGLVTAIRGQAR